MNIFLNEKFIFSVYSYVLGWNSLVKEIPFQLILEPKFNQESNEPTDADNASILIFNLVDE